MRTAVACLIFVALGTVVHSQAPLPSELCSGGDIDSATCQDAYQQRQEEMGGDPYINNYIEPITPRTDQERR